MYIELEYLEEKICILTINSPRTLNALNIELLDEMTAVIESISNNKYIRVLVITGAGKAFVAGADIEQMKGMTKGDALQLAKKGTNLFNAIENLEIPVIAAINGYALGGGCELALACDLRIASSNAKFGQPEVKLGIIPGFGGNIRLPIQIGPSLAKELIFTGRLIDAQEAFRIGLINKVIDTNNILDEATKLAEQLLCNSSNAICAAKKIINNAPNPLKNNLETIEHNYFADCFEHKHQIEGMAAFLEKREPLFKD